MTAKVAIIDYVITSNISVLSGITKIILPVVSSFKLAMHNLNELGLADYINKHCDQ
ncbi:MAG: imidazoleglycerol phosphate synthase glutamine amidotransferase subunit HisH [Bermanella sp.]|jgi:imidazoleglycerol phosphate synthase glutamine amidotransferase subunit HisH